MVYFYEAPTTVYGSVLVPEPVIITLGERLISGRIPGELSYVEVTEK